MAAQVPGNNTNNTFNDLKNTQANNGGAPTQTFQSIFSANTGGWASRNSDKLLADASRAVTEFLESQKNYLVVNFNNQHVELESKVFEVPKANDTAPPALVVYLFSKLLGITVASYLLIEPKGFRPEVNSNPNIPANAREMPRTVSSYWGLDGYRKNVMNAAKQRDPLGANNQNYFSSGYVVLPENLDVNDKGQIGGFLTNFIYGNYHLFNQLNPVRVPLTMSESDSGVTIKSNFGSPNIPLRASTGRPVASSAQVWMSQLVRDSIANDNSTTEEVFSRTDVIVGLDYLYRGGAEVIGQQAAPRLAAKTIITAIENFKGNYTLSSLLLSIASVAALSDNQSRFINTLTRVGYGNPIDLGTLGMLYPFDPVTQAHGHVDVSQTNTESLNVYMKRAILPCASVRMHIEHGGEFYWAQEVVGNAAAGHQDSIRAIINAADELTGGNFSKLWNTPQIQQTNPVIATMTSTPVIMGHYQGSGGVVRDIREVDNFMAALTMSYDHKRDTSDFYDWYRTYENNSISANERINQRLNLLMNKFPNFTHTGYASEVVFGEAFISTLITAMVATKMKWIDKIDPLTVSTGAEVFVTGNYYTTQINTSGMVNNGFNGGSANGGSYVPSFWKV